MRRMDDLAIDGLFEHYDDLTVPVSAFITFEDEDSKIFALEYEGLK